VSNECEKQCEDPQAEAVIDAAVALANAGVILIDEGGFKGIAGKKVVCLAEQAAAAVGRELEDVEEPEELEQATNASGTPAAETGSEAAAKSGGEGDDCGDGKKEGKPAATAT